MKKIALLMVGAALVASGCSSASVAATVDEISIEEASVFSLAGLPPDDGRVDGGVFRESLTFLVLQSALLGAAMDDYGIPDLSTDEERDAYLASASQRELEAISAEVDAGVAQGRDVEAAENFVVTQMGIRTMVRDAIVHDDEVLESAWDNDRDALVTVCGSHILVATEEEALDAIDRINSGEDFAAVADEVSLDVQSPGGALPCPTHAFVFVPEFAEAVSTTPIGQLSEPFQTRFGFHVVQVDSRDSPESLEQLKSDPERWLPIQLIDREYSAWLDSAVGRATVWIRSQIGAWSAQLNVVTPPPDSP